MLLLMPDALFEDDAEIERAVLRAGRYYTHELVADRIADGDWRRADALIVYYGVPIDRALIERLDQLPHSGARGGRLRSHRHRRLRRPRHPGVQRAGLRHHRGCRPCDRADARARPRPGLVSRPPARRSARRLALVGGAAGPQAARRHLRHLGMGRIGTATSRRARALDMEVCFYDPYLPDGTELGLGYRRVDSLRRCSPRPTWSASTAH